MPPRKNVAPMVIAKGRKTKPNLGYQTILSPSESITSDLLSKLRSFKTIQQALRWLKKRHPDTSQAIFNFLNLASMGHTMEIWTPDGKSRIPEAEARWNELAARVYAVSNDGLDGLINQLHESALIDNGMAIEVEVNESLDDIVDIHPIDPQTLRWEVNNGKLRPYQEVYGERIYLDNANFFWVPNDPDFDDPTGNPAFASLIAAVDFQLQTDQDQQRVLHNQGWPRYDLSIDREGAVNAAPPDAKGDVAKLRAYLNDLISDLQRTFNSLNPDDALIHFNDITAQLLEGGVNASRGMDVRAINEGVDRRILAALKQLSAFMNRTAGTTETWSTVQFQIFCQAIKGLQRKSKRLIESAARLALRVWGIQGVPKLIYKEIDHESEKARLEIRKLKTEVVTWLYLLGFITQDEAALELVDHEAVSKPIAIPNSFTIQGGVDNAPANNDNAPPNGNDNG